MAFTEDLFSDPLKNKMAGGPTVFGFKNPDGTSGEDSGVVPNINAPTASAENLLQWAVDSGYLKPAP